MSLFATVAARSRRTRRAAGVLVCALALLPGCAAPLPSPPGAAPRSFAAAGAKAPPAFAYVLIDGGFQIFAAGSRKPLRGSIVPGLAAAIGCDASGDFYVGNLTLNYVGVYAPCGTPVLRTISRGTGGPVALAFDRTGNLYVANRGAQTVSVYAPGAASPLRIVKDGIRQPSAIAIDAKGRLYVLDAVRTGFVTAYAPNGVRLQTTVRAGINHPYALAIDARDDLYVANLGRRANGAFAGSSIAIYAPRGTSPLRTIRAGISAPEALAFDHRGSLYVANAAAGANANGWITVYAAGAVTPSKTIPTGGDLPVSMAFGPGGNLYVVNANNAGPGSMTVYGPLLRRLFRTTDGIDGPLSVRACKA